MSNVDIFACSFLKNDWTWTANGLHQRFEMIRRTQEIFHAMKKNWNWGDGTYYLFCNAWMTGEGAAGRKNLSDWKKNFPRQPLNHAWLLCNSFTYKSTATTTIHCGCLLFIFGSSWATKWLELLAISWEPYQKSENNPDIVCQYLCVLLYLFSLCSLFSF